MIEQFIRKILKRTKKSVNKFLSDYFQRYLGYTVRTGKVVRQKFVHETRVNFFGCYFE